MEKVVAFIFAIGYVAVLSIIIAFPTMWSWNYLMPDLFGLQQIDFWQALVMNILAHILFQSEKSVK